MPPHQMMVTVQQVGAFAYWQQNTLFRFGSVVPCQWHASTVPAAASSDCTHVKDSPLNSSTTASSFVSPLPVRQHTATHYHPSPTPALSSRAATVDPEQPIGYGSFGVVW